MSRQCVMETRVALQPGSPTLLDDRWKLRPLGSSAFCDTWQAQRGKQKLFVKSAGRAGAAMLRAEADGVRALAATGCIRVPAVDSLSERPGGGMLLALEWLEFARPDASFGRRFGHALAALHAAPCPLEPASFGWRSDNYIGATPQRNTPLHEPTRAGWIAFCAKARLECMRDRLSPHAAELRDAVEAVAEALPRILSGEPPPRPALIHGDLWQGNWEMLADGTPVVFDPAVSCSDPGAELAMMELFGSPPPGFRAAYEEAGGHWPGPECLALYQLYHLLNHVVLFGAGYAPHALRVARSLA